MRVIGADAERLAIEPVQCRQRSWRNRFRRGVRPDLIGVCPRMPLLDAPVAARLQENAGAIRSGIGHCTIWGCRRGRPMAVPSRRASPSPKRAPVFGVDDDGLHRADYRRLLRKPIAESAQSLQHGRIKAGLDHGCRILGGPRQRHTWPRHGFGYGEAMVDEVERDVEQGIDDGRAARRAVCRNRAFALIGTCEDHRRRYAGARPLAGCDVVGSRVEVGVFRRSATPRRRN